MKKKKLKKIVVMKKDCDKKEEIKKIYIKNGCDNGKRLL